VLSDSEAEVYPLLLRGLSNKEIAAALGIELSAATLRVHRCCRALGVSTVRRLLARRIADLEQRLAGGPAGTPEQPC
jgi:DNA-binding NarL/FixJ family response regulator